MKIPIEPVLTLKSPDVLLHRLRVELGRHGEAARDGGAWWLAPDYRAAVGAEVQGRFGSPVPRALDELVEEGRALGVPPDAMAAFIGREFRLKQLRRYSNNSN